MEKGGFTCFIRAPSIQNLMGADAKLNNIS